MKEALWVYIRITNSLLKKYKDSPVVFSTYEFVLVGISNCDIFRFLNLIKQDSKIETHDNIILKWYKNNGDSKPKEVC